MCALSVGGIMELFEKLADGFDRMPLRLGDKVERASSASQPSVWNHSNTYNVPGVVKQAFGELGTECISSSDTQRIVQL